MVFVLLRSDLFIWLFKLSGGEVDGETYWNRKKRYAINAQLIIDYNKRILYLYCGHTASVHDSRIFKKTSVYRYSTKFFSKGEYLLADSAYELSTTIITPYKNPASQLRNNKKFNYFHSNVRVAVEHVNGILKQRFQSLNGIRVAVQKKTQHTFIVEWFEACCILHNILLKIDPWDVENTLVPKIESEHHFPSAQAEEMRRKIRTDVLLFNNLEWLKKLRI